MKMYINKCEKIKSMSSSELAHFLAEHWDCDNCELSDGCASLIDICEERIENWLNKDI